jgi:hypothetical protein
MEEEEKEERGERYFSLGVPARTAVVRQKMSAAIEAIVMVSGEDRPLQLLSGKVSKYKYFFTTLPCSFFL